MYTLIYIYTYIHIWLLKLAHIRKTGYDMAWKRTKTYLRLLHCTLQNVYTETTLGSKSTERNKEHCSLHIRGGITIYSHEWTMSHGLWNFLIYSRINIYIFSSRYCYSSCKLHLTLDRSREARYWKQTDFKYRSCDETFIFTFYFIFSFIQD